MSTAARTFADWALGLRLGDVPSGATRAATTHLLDGVGCAIAAHRLGAVPHATDAAGRWAAPEEATVIGDGRRLPAPMAALANGVLVHALDFDDTHAAALVHATAAVLPAAFAAGEETGASGEDVLTAAIAGYETVIRLGAAVTHGFHARGFHATSVCGVFGSALIASRLMGSSLEQTVSALGIAGSLAGGSLEFLNAGTPTKPLHAGLAAMNGIVAARLAASGAIGPETIFEGGHGLFAAYADAAVDAPALTDELGARWETTRISIKPYPACQLSHAPLDALRSVLGEIGDADAVDEIVFDVVAGSAAIVCHPIEVKQRPRSEYDAKFSLPYCAAALVLDKELTVSSFEPERLARADVLALAARVGYRERADAGAPADAPGLVEVRMRDGRTVRAEVDAHATDPDVEGKFHANCGGRTPASERLAAQVLSLAEAPGLAPLLKATAL